MTRTSKAVAAVLAVVVCLTAISAAAKRRGTGKPRHPVMFQVTELTTGSIWSPQLRSEAGTTIAFVSDGDVLGPGSETSGREVYLNEVYSRTTRRLTESGLGESYDASRQTDSAHSPRQTYVAFISTANLDPSVGNFDGNPELFIWLSDENRIKQLTNTLPPVINAEPYPSDSGKCIAFRSTGNYDNNIGQVLKHPGRGFQNLDGSHEVFKIDFVDDALTEMVFTQVSDGPAGTFSGQPTIGGFWYTRQCRSTTYVSDHDQLNNGSTGRHVYNYTRTSGAIEQLSKPSASTNYAWAMTSASNFARGPFVPFQSSEDQLGNGSSNEIYRFRLFKSEVKQLTWSGGVGESRNPVISDGGGFVIFESSAELVDPRRSVRGPLDPPFNADGNYEIVRLKGQRTIWPITVSENCDNGQISTRDTGRSLAFRSTCDHVPGHNPAGLQQVFFYSELGKRDPLVSAAGCTVANGCCNVANGCYKPVQGRIIDPPKPRKVRPEWNRGG